MMSRIQSINDLLILRPFLFDKITSHQSQETRDELTQLQHLHDETFQRMQSNQVPYIIPSTSVQTQEQK